MAEWIKKALAANPDDLNLIPGLRLWKEKTDSSKLSSELHMHSMACLYAQVHTNTINICNNDTFIQYLHTCNTMRFYVEAGGGSGVQIRPHLQNEFQDSLGYYIKREWGRQEMQLSWQSACLPCMKPWVRSRTTYNLVWWCKTVIPVLGR